MLCFFHILNFLSMQDSCCGDKKGCACCNNTLHCVARWTYAVPLFVFGLLHLINGQSMTGMLAGWPFSLFFVYLSGAGLILAAIAIALNRYARLATTLLAIELGLFVLCIHIPSIVGGGAGAQMSFMFALKDLALVGGALLIASQSTNRGFSAK